MKRTMKKLKKMFLAMLTVCILIGCVNPVPVQAIATKPTNAKGTYYYVTQLNNQKGGLSPNKEYWTPGTKKVTYTSNSITFYSSFSKTNKTTIKFNKANFREYAKRTFKVNSKTKYYCLDIWSKEPISKANAFRTCKSLNGLCLTIKVKNGIVQTMTFTS